MKFLHDLGLKLDQSKLKDYSFSVDEVIAVQSSKYYAKTEKDLGYYTIAQHEENYRRKLAELLEEFAILLGKDASVKILELGGGTGKFALYVTNYLLSKDIKYEYTIVDVSTSQYREELRKQPKLKIQEDTFTNFAEKNKNIYDILIMNEALDMWAGEEELLNEWDDGKLPVKVYWVLVDLEKKELVKKKQVSKLSAGEKTHFVWKQVLIKEETGEVLEQLQEQYRNKIQLPAGMTKLLQKIRLFSVIQDYWSFDEQENRLRMGLYEESVEKTLQRMEKVPEKLSKELAKDWTEKLEKGPVRKAWIESQEIPFGLVDVTYSPNQGKLFELSLELDLELVNYYAENVQQFDDKIYSVGELENEVFILFTQYASELRFKKDLM